MHKSAKDAEKQHEALQEQSERAEARVAELEAERDALAAQIEELRAVTQAGAGAAEAAGEEASAKGPEGFGVPVEAQERLRALEAALALAEEQLQASEAGREQVEQAKESVIADLQARLEALTQVRGRGLPPSSRVPWDMCFVLLLFALFRPVHFSTGTSSLPPPETPRTCLTFSVFCTHT